MAWRAAWLPGASRLAAALLATGCSAVVDVRALATGRADVAAYELRGPELPMLQREARRLCPQGGEVLRQSGHDQRSVDDEGSIRRWLIATHAVLDPPRRQSQLVVVCKEAADTTFATASTPKPTVDAAMPVAVPMTVPMTVPLAPISVEW
jgi:hypothetical protein